MAVGATASDVAVLVLKEGSRRAAGGLFAGLALSAGLARALAAMLYGVSPLDAKTYVSVAGLLTIVVLTASCIPAWRASRVDPMLAVRLE